MPERRFVCVQSVFVDDRDRLWILDAGNPNFGGVVPGGPKLIEVDLERDRVTRVIPFDATAAPAGSYLNDVRVDTASGHLYLTDSGSGALVVVDAVTGRARRLLAGHSSTRAEDLEVLVGGRRWPGRVHADGLALSPDRQWLYYRALTSRTLYRVPAAALRDPQLDEPALAALIEKVVETGAADGIAFGPDGRLYLTAIEEDAIQRLEADGDVRRVLVDRRLAWPDSLAAAGGWLYVTTSQIHLGPSPAEPHLLLRFRPPPA